MPNKRNRGPVNMLAHANDAMKKEREMENEREKLDPENMSVQDRKMKAIQDIEAQPGVHETLPAAGQPDGEPVRKTETETEVVREAVSDAVDEFDPADLSDLGPVEETETDKQKKAREKAEGKEFKAQEKREDAAQEKKQKEEDDAAEKERQRVRQFELDKEAQKVASDNRRGHRFSKR